MDILKAFKTLLDGFLSLEKRANEREDRIQKKLQEKLDAINSVRLAAIATKVYLYDVETTNTISREKEEKLAESWQNVANLIYNFDRQLFEISKVKALGWADPREWKKLEGTVTTVQLDDIISQCDYITRSMH